MPFDIAPQVKEAPAKVGKYEHLADAMLRGCAVTKLAIGLQWDGKDGCCALGAIRVGLGARLGVAEESFYCSPRSYTEQWDLMDAYRAAYGTHIADDNNSRTFTREQIAERIRAL